MFACDAVPGFMQDRLGCFTDFRAQFRCAFGKRVEMAHLAFASVRNLLMRANP